MLFLIFFIFTNAMIAMAFFVSTLVHTQSSANQLAYTFVLMTIIFQAVFSQQDVNNMFLYNDETSGKFSIRMARLFFNSVPSFTFSVTLGALIKVASTHLDPQSIIWVKGRKYGWDDFTRRETGSIVLDVTYTMPSGMESLMILLGDVVMYLVLAWYFDHVISNNRGVADPPYFLFTKKYWMSWKKSDPNEGAAIRASRGKKSDKKKKDKKKKRKLNMENVMNDYSGDLNLHEENSSAKKDSVKKEQKKVKDLESESAPCEGLRIIGLRKTYFKKAFDRPSKDDVHAVRGVYLEVPDRELLCLLGHNGAGKSTLFSMLTGVLKPT